LDRKTPDIASLIRATIAVIDENVGKAATAQPSLQRGRLKVILARMAYEKNRHKIPSAAPAYQHD